MTSQPDQTTADLSAVMHALGLMKSMIACGDSFTPQSTARVVAAYAALGRLAVNVPQGCPECSGLLVSACPACNGLVEVLCENSGGETEWVRKADEARRTP